MPATAMVAARIEPEIKERVRPILETRSLSESQLIRNVYEYIAYLGDVPEFFLMGTYQVDPATGERIGKRGKRMQMLSAIETNPYLGALAGATDEDLEAALADSLLGKHAPEGSDE